MGLIWKRLFWLFLYIVCEEWVVKILMREGYRKEQKKTMKAKAVKGQKIEVEKQQLTGERYRFPIKMSSLFFGCGLYSLQCTYIRSKG